MNGTTTGGSTGNGSASAGSVPVFNGNGGQVGVAVTNPATGTVELVGPGGTILGVIEQQNGAVDLIGAGGAVIGGFTLNQATGQVVLGAPPAAGNTTSTAGSGGTTTGGTTATVTGATTGTAPAGQPTATMVPVYDSFGVQIGVAVTNPATGAAELIGPGGSVLGVIQPQKGAVSLIGAGGTVTGTFSVNQGTGQVILSAGGGAGTMTTSATSPTTAPGAATSGTVPVFDVSGIQIGIAVANPATGSVELVGVNGAILGVIAQQNGTLALVGAGGTVLGSFAVNQATGQVVFVSATGTTASPGA